MESFTILYNGFSMIFEVKYFLLMFAGVAFGLVLAALPGLTSSMGIALMLPFTYNLEPLTSLVFLLSIYSGGILGGGVTAILINTPGSPANIATVLDGYPMTLKGRAEEALGISLWSSVIGGLIGCIFLFFVMESLANLALRFGPPEMFMIAIFGLSVVGSLSSNPIKSIYGGLFGILLGTIGMSPSGVVRGTMGSYYLLDGIPFLPALIGLLAIPELFSLAGRNFVVDTMDTKFSLRRIISSGWREIVRHPVQVVLCSVTGVIVGVMPAAGGSIAGLLSYNQSKQWSRRHAEFGTGIPEGVIAAETANNASEGGALATMLVLGIPGSSNTAMLIGAVMIQGWVPGPKMFLDNKEVIYASVSSLFLQQIVMFILTAVFCVYAVRIIKIPTRILVPCIILFTLLGSYSTRNALFDCGLMLAFGAAGWILKKSGFAIMSVVLGIILGPIADRELLRIGQLYNGDILPIFNRPIVLALFLFSVLSVIAPMLFTLVRNMRGKREAA